MSLRRTIARNVVSSWAGYAAQAIVAFLLTPFVLRSLGETRYGIWTLAMGLTGYYGLLDLGISSGVAQYLTRYLAEKDFVRLNRTASTGFFTLVLFGASIFVCSLVVATHVATLFHIPAGLTHEVSLVILITGLSVTLQFSFFIYSAVFTAVQRFDLSNVIGVITRLFSVALMVASLKLGYGLAGISLALALSNLVDYVIRWRIARSLLPLMKISLHLFSRQHLGEIAKFGVWNLAVAGGVRLISYTDTLVIAAFMPISAVAPFAIASSLRSYFDDIFVRAGYVFFPAATELDAQGDRAGLQRLYLVSSKFMCLGSVWCGMVAICWAQSFFRLWIGEEFARPAGYPSVALLFWLLLSSSMVSVGQRIGYQVLMGMRRVPLLAVLLASEGVVNLALSIILVRRIGLSGVALGTLIPAIVFQGILQPLFVCRILEVPLTKYFRQVLLRPILALLALFPVVLMFSMMEQPAGWPVLFVYGISSALLMTPIVGFIGLERDERWMFAGALRSTSSKLLAYSGVGRLAQ